MNAEDAAMTSGRNIPLSLPRRLVCDVVHFARQVPTIPVQKLVNVAELEPLRCRLDPRPSWCALFTKAYALVSAEFPELRRAYLSVPWARLYEHPETIASLAVERDYGGEKGVLFAQFRSPEKLDLLTLESRMRRFKEDPVESIPDFRSLLAITRLPWPLRRLAWWYITHVRGYRKATWMGTFGVSVYSSLGAESLHPLSPLTTLLNYGVIQENGEVTVRVVYDHRVMDGATVARALGRLEQVLNQEIFTELRDLAARQALEKATATTRSAG
jgi:hypothetical protein